jgi:RNA-directed DNA polymerase
MLDDLDRELWSRGHRFVRHADDLRVFVRSERAAQRVFESVCGVIERRLKLKVNRGEVLDPARRGRDAAGVGVLLRRPVGQDPGRPQGGQAAEEPATGTDRAELEGVDGVPHRQAQQVHHGWMAYYRLAEAEPVFRSLGGWLRRRLRQVRWKEWKSTAAKRHNLRMRGISGSNARKWAGSSKGYWWVAGSKVVQVSLPIAYWNRLGLKTLSQTWQRLNSIRRLDEPPDAGPHVWWCGRGPGRPRPPTRYCPSGSGSSGGGGRKDPGGTPISG